MKKSIAVALITTTLINSGLFIANLMSAYTQHELLFGKEIAGGECIEYIGFGVRLLKIFSFGPVEEASPNIYHIYFDPKSIIIPIIMVFAITFVISYTIIKVRKGKEK